MLRIATAVVLIGLLALALWAHPLAFVALLGGAVLLGWREFAGLAAEAGAAPLRGAGPLAALACALSFAAGEPVLPAVALTGSVVLVAVAGLVAGRRHPALAVRRTAATLGGICWLGLLPGCQIALRLTEQGIGWLALLYASVSGGDIAAYYGGRLLGRHPLAPALSPNKTLEGSAFGLAASVAGAMVADRALLLGLGPGHAVLLGLALGAVGQAGDLMESSLKRAARIKDSSSLLPGHGGVLDRLDGVLFGGAVLYGVVALGWV